MEGLLREVLRNQSDALTVDERQQTVEYLDHNELGLAWEWLVDALAELPGAVPSADLHRLRKAAGLMSMDLALQARWQQLVSE